MQKQIKTATFTMIFFGIPDKFGNIYTKESFDYKGFDFMKSTGDIIDYLVTDEKIDITIDINRLNNNAIDITC